ncbi:MAG: hypothetical protein IPH46_05015 [Bacteroidetes bacterium]|nr:hypothetical protein [Bacteroidota bacterium]
MTFTDFEMNYEILLIKKWQEYIVKTKSDIQQMIDPKVFIAGLNLIQPKLYTEEIKRTKSAIKHSIETNLLYFINEYGKERNWDFALYSIYEDITNLYFEIGNEEPSHMYLLYYKLVNYKERLKRDLEFFDSVFEYFISLNKIDDCIRFLNVFSRIMTLYNELLNESRYNFKESYFYSTINDYYIRIESKYNAEKLKLRTPIISRHKDIITDSNTNISSNLFNKITLTEG